MKTATVQIIRRESFTTQLFFTTRPDRATRQALKDAGFRFNGLSWWKNVNSTAPMKHRELSDLLAPLAANDNDPNISDVLAAAMA